MVYNNFLLKREKNLPMLNFMSKAIFLNINQRIGQERVNQIPSTNSCTAVNLTCISETKEL